MSISTTSGRRERPAPLPAQICTSAATSSTTASAQSKATGLKRMLRRVGTTRTLERAPRHVISQPADSTRTKISRSADPKIGDPADDRRAAGA